MSGALRHPAAITTLELLEALLRLVGKLIYSK